MVDIFMIGHCDSALNMGYALHHTAHLRERLVAEVRLRLQKCNANSVLLLVSTYLGMEVWNGMWKKILVWNGRFLVWNGNGKEENFQYGIWKNRLPYHTLRKIRFLLQK